MFSQCSAGKNQNAVATYFSCRQLLSFGLEVRAVLYAGDLMRQVYMGLIKPRRRGRNILL